MKLPKKLIAYLCPLLIEILKKIIKKFEEKEKTRIDNSVVLNTEDQESSNKIQIEKINKSSPFYCDICRRSIKESKMITSNINGSVCCDCADKEK